MISLLTVLKRPSALKQININILTENRREINHGLITNANLPEKTIGNLKENLKRKGRKPLNKQKRRLKSIIKIHLIRVVKITGKKTVSSQKI